MELEDTMASLRLNDSLKKDSPFEPDAALPEEPSPPEPRRSSRLKTRTTYTEKRRVCTKPMKVSLKNNENYYLNKRKASSPSLETIYEDKEDNQPKFKKKQRMKVKSVSAQQRINNKKKISLKLLLDKLAELDE